MTDNFSLLSDALAIVVENQIGKRISLIDLWNLRKTCKKVNVKLHLSFNERTQYPFKDMISYIMKKKGAESKFDKLLNLLNQKRVRIFGSTALWLISETTENHSWLPNDIDVHIPLDYDLHKGFDKMSISESAIQNIQNDISLNNKYSIDLFDFGKDFTLHLVTASVDTVDIDLCATQIGIFDTDYIFSVRSSESISSRTGKIIYMYDTTNNRIEKYQNRGFNIDFQSPAYKRRRIQRRGFYQNG